LGVSQPTVTARIQTLERLLGVQLFVRAESQLSLTPAGRALYETGERALRTLYDGLDMLSAFQEGEQAPAPLAIGATPTLSTYFVPHVLEHFLASHAGYPVSVHTTYTPDQVEMMVLDEVVHVGFVRERFEHPDVLCRHLHR